MSNEIGLVEDTVIPLTKTVENINMIATEIVIA